VQHLCTCGAPLLARYDLERAARTFSRTTLAARDSGLWRYTELLPLRELRNRVTFGEQPTPIVHLQRTGLQIGVQSLFLKDESTLPTASFKARGAAAGVSRARELGVRAFAMPTNGNAGAAWSAYAARAGIAAHIVMPRAAPPINRLECTASGAHLTLCEGTIADAGRIVAGEIAAHRWYDASTLKEPYRIEGKKTIAFEFVEQMHWRLPDVIVYPTGGGVGLIGIHKALLELRAIGLIEGPLPRYVAVQSAGCAPIVEAFKQGKRESSAWPDANTVAFGINVPKALGDFLVLEALAATQGTAIAVSDEQLLETQRRIFSTEGIFVCPEGGATLAAAIDLFAQGWIQKDETVLLINTGSGLKYPEAV